MLSFFNVIYRKQQNSTDLRKKIFHPKIFGKDVVVKSNVSEGSAFQSNHKFFYTLFGSKFRPIYITRRG